VVLGFYEEQKVLVFKLFFRMDSISIPKNKNGTLGMVLL
jgi:hypothetical protein